MTTCVGFRGGRLQVWRKLHCRIRDEPLRRSLYRFVRFFRARAGIDSLTIDVVDTLGS